MLQAIKKLLERNALLIAIIATIVLGIASLSVMPKIDFGFKLKSSDKYLHAIAYFMLTTIWFFAFRDKIKKYNFKLILVLALIIYGIVIEGLQGSITSSRTADFYDEIANMFGILIATLCFNRLIKWFNSI